MIVLASFAMVAKWAQANSSNTLMTVEVASIVSTESSSKF